MCTLGSSSYELINKMFEQNKTAFLLDSGSTYLAGRGSVLDGGGRGSVRVRLAAAAAALGLRSALHWCDGIRDVIGRKRLRNRLQGGSHRGRHRTSVARAVVDDNITAANTTTVDHCCY